MMDIKTLRDALIQKMATCEEANIVKDVIKDSGVESLVEMMIEVFLATAKDVDPEVEIKVSGQFCQNILLLIGSKRMELLNNCITKEMRDKMQGEIQVYRLAESMGVKPNGKT